MPPLLNIPFDLLIDKGPALAIHPTEEDAEVTSGVTVHSIAPVPIPTGLHTYSSFKTLFRDDEDPLADLEDILSGNYKGYPKYTKCFTEISYDEVDEVKEFFDAVIIISLKRSILNYRSNLQFFLFVK